MRTTVDIDDALMNEVMEKTRFRTKKEAIEAGLRAVLHFAEQVAAFEDMRGLGWDDGIEGTYQNRAAS